MDPYLENPARWPGVHHRLITYIGDALTTLLPPGYEADIGERLYVVQADREIYPDVALRKRASGRQKVTASAVAIASDPSWELTLDSDEIREGFIQITKTEDSSKVITILEVLSPSNKASGSEGRRLYREKQREVLASSCHLLEIDLLREGAHTVAAPQEKLLRKGVWDYLISLSRGGERDRCEVWAITLSQRLPRFRVPLAGEDPDVVLDLQDLILRVYDNGRYADKLNYRAESIPALSRSASEWAAALLREHGLRPNT